MRGRPKERDMSIPIPPEPVESGTEMILRTAREKVAQLTRDSLDNSGNQNRLREIGIERDALIVGTLLRHAIYGPVPAGWNINLIPQEPERRFEVSIKDRTDPNPIAYAVLSQREGRLAEHQELVEKALGILRERESTEALPPSAATFLISPELRRVQSQD